MVDMVAYYWKQVPQTALYIPDALSVFGQPAGKFPEALRFELLVVHNDAALLPESFAERRYKGPTRIAAVSSQKFQMFRCCPRLFLHVDRPLKRKVVVRVHTEKSRDRRIDGF